MFAMERWTSVLRRWLKASKMRSKPFCFIQKQGSSEKENKEALLLLQTASQFFLQFGVSLEADSLVRSAVDNFLLLNVLK